MNAKKIALIVLATLIGVSALYFTAVLKWSYSTGERAGWVQKLSHKGWICKTWEGELALVSMPGAPVQIFAFTVHDDKVAEDINRLMGQRVSLHYEEKVGLPTNCFGDTRYFVTKVIPVEGISLSPGVVVTPSHPASQAQAASAPSAEPGASSPAP
ncbi:MAG: hypothetical protein RI907_2830 [Pseudomonadota bacterium]|jgi:hypothetical protein